MLDALKQWVLVLLAAALAIPLVQWMYHALEAADGLQGVPIVLAAKPLVALIVMLVTTICLSVLAIVVGRLTHRYTGNLTYGLCLTMVALYSAPVDDLLRLIDEFGGGFAGKYILLALECVIWAIPALTVVVVNARWAPNRYDDEVGPLKPASLQALVIALIAGAVLCWVMVRTNEKGQAVYGVMAGIALAVGGVRLAWPHCNGTLLFAIPLVVGIVGQVSGAFVMGDEALQTLGTGKTWPLARPTPMDYLGPGVMGVSVGIWLARTFGHEHEHEAETGPSNSAAASA